MMSKNQISKILFVSLVAGFFQFGLMPIQAEAVTASCSVTAASLSAADVQTAINSATDGQTVCLPPGTGEWTSPVTINKAITLKGAGAGGYVFNHNGGESTTAVAVGTGSKTFTVPSGLDFVTGETITARYIDELGANFMTGTVASYSGTTLALNINTIGGSGTRSSWVFERPASTTIKHSVNFGPDDVNSGLLVVSESTSGNVQVTGINFDRGTGTGGRFIVINRTTNGKPILVHHNRFQTVGSYPNEVVGGVQSNSNRGVVWDNSFNAQLCSSSDAGCSTYVSGAVGVNSDGSTLENSWTTPSKMGSADTDGTGNFYVEDNYFLNYWQSLTGCDSNARMVLRYNVIHNSTIGGHGADTESYGLRYCEVYNNRFVLTLQNQWPGAYNINRWVQFRGGTGTVHDNVMPDITGSMYGDKAEITMEVQNLARSGTNGCWGFQLAPIQYPVPRQIGLGYVTGSGVDGKGRTNDVVTYVGDPEPIYIWNNSRTPVIGIQDAFTSFGTSYCGGTQADYDLTSDYIQAGRDYIMGPKPNYTPYTYPHPLTLATSTPPSITLSGDLNKDCTVNSLDWSIMNSKWYTNDATADLNHDGVVNTLDWSIMNANWFKTCQ